MQFPEVQQWASNVVQLIQIIGGAIAAICVAIIGIMILTSQGNEHKMAAAKVAAVALALGIAVVFGADKIANVFKALVAFIGH